MKKEKNTNGCLVGKTKRTYTFQDFFMMYVQFVV